MLWTKNRLIICFRSPQHALLWLQIVCELLSLWTCLHVYKVCLLWLPDFASPQYFTEDLHRPIILALPATIAQFSSKTAETVLASCTLLSNLTAWDGNHGITGICSVMWCMCTAFSTRAGLGIRFVRWSVTVVRFSDPFS